MKHGDPLSLQLMHPNQRYGPIIKGCTPEGLQGCGSQSLQSGCTSEASIKHGPN